MEHYEARRNECKLHKGTEEMLASCDQFCTQSVLSAYQQQDLQDVLDQYEISKYFANVCGHHDIYASGKIESGKALFKELDMPARDILFIGDTTHDYEVAQAIGVDCILLAQGHQSKHRLDTLGISIFNDIGELEALFRKD